MTIRTHLETCPDTLIECRYCFLTTERGLMVTGRDLFEYGPIGAHEMICGARTIQCIQCSHYIKKSHVQSHFKIHRMNLHQKIENKDKPRNQANGCKNVNCSIQKQDNVMGLCGWCFEVFWSADDDSYQRMKRKIVRVYHDQLMYGCNRNTCTNTVKLQLIYSAFSCPF